MMNEYEAPDEVWLWVWRRRLQTTRSKLGGLLAHLDRRRLKRKTAGLTRVKMGSGDLLDEDVTDGQMPEPSLGDLPGLGS
jgi:hypothetical protein